MSIDSGNKSALISVEELSSLIGKEKVKIFDVRGTWKTPARALKDDYLADHIPGSVFLDWTKHFIEPGVPLNLASVAPIDLANNSFESLGINSEDLVVLYDDYFHMFAGRIWWAMKYWGLSQVKVLNGGWNHWKRQNLPTSSTPEPIKKGSFQACCQDDLRTSLKDFLIKKDNSYVIDARGSANYQGKPQDLRSGHIPGSVSIPYKDLLSEETGLFLPPSHIKNLLSEIVPKWQSTPLIASCGSGYAGTVLMLAMRELGRSSSLFDESFAVWKQDPARPVEQGKS